MITERIHVMIEKFTVTTGKNTVMTEKTHGDNEKG